MTPVAKKATAAELRERFVRKGLTGYAEVDAELVREVDAIMEAARAEAVAPVLDVMRQLVAALPRCTAGGCGSAACDGCEVMCGLTATRGVVCDEHGDGEPDSDYAAPLRAALALLAEHKEGK